jgi:hypothetical protein
MKKLIIYGAVLLGIVALCNIVGLVTVMAQVDTVVVKESFYSKYSGVIWTAIGLVGGGVIITFMNSKLNKVYAALKTIIDAAQDGHVSEQEFQTIVKAVKAIWAKEIANAETVVIDKRK